MYKHNMLYKILRYLVQASIIYLLLRYFPYSNMSTQQAGIATLIIILLCMIVEQLLISYKLSTKSNTETFLNKFKQNNKSCNSCKIEKFEDDIIGTMDTSPPSPNGSTIPSEQNSTNIVPNTDGLNSSMIVPQNSTEIQSTINIPQNSINQPSVNMNSPTQISPVEIPTITTNKQTHGVMIPSINGQTAVVIPQTNTPIVIPQNKHNDKISKIGRNCRIVCSNDIPQHIDINNPVVPKLQDKQLINEGFNSNLGVNQTNTVTTQPITTVPIRPNDRIYWENSDYGGMYYDENPFYNKFRNDDDIDRNIEGPFRNAEDKRKLMEERQRVINTLEQIDQRARTIDGYYSKFQIMGPKSEKLKTTDNRRRIVGILDDELPYTDYNHLPLASGYKSHDYEYGYSFLPPEKWYPQPPRPPVCVTEKRCPVCPTYTNGTPVDAKEFHSSRRITPPDMINMDYIGDKLNAGR